MKDFTTITNRDGRGTTVPTIKNIYNSYGNGTINKIQTLGFLYDWGLVSGKDMKKAIWKK